MQRKTLLFLVLISHISMSAMERYLEANAQNSTVSLIYYPTSYAILGHVELEIDGNSWELFKYPIFKALQDMVARSTHHGLPFFRFLFNADSDQIEKIKCSIGKRERYFTCSRAVCAVLKEAGICSVPDPFNVMPILTATYLMGGRGLRCNNVQRVEYYGNPSLLKSIAKMAPGLVAETGFIISCGGIAKTAAVWHLQEDDDKSCSENFM